MVKIRNRLQQPILIYRGKGMGSPIHLLAGEAAVLDEKEVELPQVQALIAAEALECRAHKKERAGDPPAEPPAGRGRRSAAAVPVTGGGASPVAVVPVEIDRKKDENMAPVEPASKREG